jgi:hypothetical protein
MLRVPSHYPTLRRSPSTKSTHFKDALEHLLEDAAWGLPYKIHVRCAHTTRFTNNKRIRSLARHVYSVCHRPRRASMGLGLKRKGRRQCVGVGGALFPSFAARLGHRSYDRSYPTPPLAPRSRAWSRAAKLLRVKLREPCRELCQLISHFRYNTVAPSSAAVPRFVNHASHEPA